MPSIILYSILVIGGTIIFHTLTTLSQYDNPLITSLFTVFMATFFSPGTLSLLQESNKDNHRPMLAPSEELTWVMVIASLIIFLLNSKELDGLVTVIIVLLVMVYRSIEHTKNPRSNRYAGIYSLSVIFSIIYAIVSLASLSFLDIVGKGSTGILVISMLLLTGLSVILHGEITRRKD